MSNYNFIMVDFDVSVVIPAAGTGQRMGSETPKQYLQIVDKPLICYAIETFEQIPWIQQVIVVGPTADHQRQHLENIIRNFKYGKVVCVSGKPTRHGSIFSGINFLDTCKKSPDVVIVHDGVRPFLEESLLKEVVIAAKKHGASGVVRPLVSTVLAKNLNGFLSHSLDRSKFVASEMPQAFHFDVILNAYNKCSQHDIDYGTECLHLALKYCNVAAFLIDGPDYLWKVTYKKDLFAAEGIIKANLRQSAVFMHGRAQPILANLLKRQFEINQINVIDYNESMTNLEKVNIVVDFSFLFNGNNLENHSKEDVVRHLQTLHKNSIFVTLCGGDEQMTIKLRRKMDEMCKKNSSFICCAVWCENFFNPSSNELIERFSEMIVTVAKETSQICNGQVFTTMKYNINYVCDCRKWQMTQVYNHKNVKFKKNKMLSTCSTISNDMYRNLLFVETAELLLK